jgi:hypothetical protein
MRIRTSGLGAFLLLAAGLIWPDIAKSELILTVGNAIVPQNGIGFVDVYLRSTVANANLLDFVVAEFQITSGGATQLAFISPTTDTHLFDSGYLFAGDGANVLLDLPASLLLTTLTTNDTYLGGDGTYTGEGVLVPTDDTLLFRLGVTTLSDEPPVEGDLFTLNVILGPGTGFFTPDIEELTLADSSRLAGVITIGPASTSSEVPEPSSLLLMGLTAAVGIFSRHGWRMRTCS